MAIKLLEFVNNLHKKFLKKITYKKATSMQRRWRTDYNQVGLKNARLNPLRQERGTRGEVTEVQLAGGKLWGIWRVTKRCCASASFVFSNCAVRDWRLATSDWCKDIIPAWKALNRSCSAPLVAPRDAHSWAKRSLLRTSSANWASARDNLHYV